MGSRSGGSLSRLQSRGWRELKSSAAGKSLQLMVRSVMVVLILAEFKLLLQNGSIQPSQLWGAQPPGHVPTAATQPRGQIRHPRLCLGQGASCWTMLELVYILRLSPPSTNPSCSPRVCLPGCAAQEDQTDLLQVGSGERVRLWPFPQGATFAVGWPGRPMLAHRQVLRMVCYLCKILCSLPPLPWPSWQQPSPQQAPRLVAQPGSAAL